MKALSTDQGKDNQKEKEKQYKASNTPINKKKKKRQ